MAERSSLNQTIQVGLEATPGTAVPARKKFQSIGIEPSPTTEVDQFRPAGQKYKGLTALSKEWVTAAVSGRATYTEIVYLLSSIIDAPTITTPGGATDARLWTFESDSSDDDDPQTFTVEHGSSFRADSFTHALVTELGLTFNRSAIEASGSMMGTSISDNITRTAPRTVTDAVVTNSDATVTSADADFTSADVGALLSGTGIPAGTRVLSVTDEATIEMTANATATNDPVTVVIGALEELELIPVLPTEVSVYLDDGAGSLGTTKLLRVLNAEWSLGSRFGPVWTVDAAQASWAAFVETEPDLMMTMLMEADSQGMTQLSRLRDGDTRHIRIEAVGAEIESGQNYTLTIDQAVKVAGGGSFSDQDGVYAVEWNFLGVHDPDWDKAFEVSVKNGQTEL